MLDKIQELTVNRWLAVTVPEERIFGLYLGSALIIAFLSWLYYRRKDASAKPDSVKKGFFGYVFDRDVYFHPSARQDYLYFLVNGLIYVGLISQILLSANFFMVMAHDGLIHVFGTRETPALPPSTVTLALYTLVYALCLDFAIFITHYAQHKVPVLWQFHQVHHSAEVLTPVTLYRMHPVDLFVSGLAVSLLSGLAFAVFFYLTNKPPHAFEIMGLNAVIFLFYLMGYNLRHSQVWLNYPGWLSRILISPAQHQIHHSTQPRHFDKNMGLIFAFWDGIFRTLYVPKSYENISYGLTATRPNPFSSVRDMYLVPFKNAWALIHPSGQNALILALALLFLTINYAAFLSLDHRIWDERRPLPSVHMEELTWTEIDRALHERGYDTVLIPTGGTEQNGAHVVLGKHNYIVRYTAEKIAQALGDALVAPVIATVPEDVHMTYAGTLSMPENVFEDILQATTESYIRHGFTTILFIGDSGGNQDGQKNVAAKLDARWKKDGVTVAHIGDYYSANGQIDRLLGRGYTMEQIGGHAGIRDTSEMLFVHPGGVRKHPWYVKGRDTGHNGDRSKASGATGKTMIELKIQAALKQIHALRGDDEKTAVPLDETLPATPYK